MNILKPIKLMVLVFGFLSFFEKAQSMNNSGTGLIRELDRCLSMNSGKKECINRLYNVIIASFEPSQSLIEAFEFVYSNLENHKRQICSQMAEEQVFQAYENLCKKNKDLARLFKRFWTEHSREAFDACMNDSYHSFSDSLKNKAFVVAVLVLLYRIIYAAQGQLLFN